MKHRITLRTEQENVLLHPIPFKTMLKILATATDIDIVLGWVTSIAQVSAERAENF